MTTCLPGCLSARALRAKFDQIPPHFDERRRRLYLASEATAIGHGGITRVAAASGTSTTRPGPFTCVHGRPTVCSSPAFGPA